MNKDVIINNPEYNFLKENKYLGKNICLLTLGGSLAYGTNIPGKSDIDVRGITLTPKSALLGFDNFEQVVDKNTDTVVYSFNKMVKLLLNCNPNTIEILGNRPEDYFVLNETGKILIKNRKMFLSQRAGYTFGAYAKQQLNRLLNASARQSPSQVEQEKQILNSVQAAMCSFNTRYNHFEFGSIIPYVDKSKETDMDSEIFVDANVKHLPIREFNGILNEMHSIVKEYKNVNHRNNKKDKEHLNKHAMHLVRLYLMGIDILEKEEIITYRKDDKDFLLEIRNGKFMSEDGSYDESFFDLINDLSKKFEYAIKNTSLPEKPDYKKVEKMVVEVNKKTILI